MALQNDATVHQLFEEQALRTPDLTAVWFEGKSLSYRELQGRVNQLACAAPSEATHGVERDVPAGVLCCIDRSTSVVALLAIQTAGGGYVPLDPELPARASFLHARGFRRLSPRVQRNPQVELTPVRRRLLGSSMDSSSIAASEHPREVEH